MQRATKVHTALHARINLVPLDEILNKMKREAGSQGRSHCRGPAR